MQLFDINLFAETESAHRYDDDLISSRSSDCEMEETEPSKESTRKDEQLQADITINEKSNLDRCKLMFI